VSSSLRPSTPVTLSVLQMLSYAIAVGGIGFTVGAIYPRITVLETSLTELQKVQQQTAQTLVKLTTIVDRIEQEQGRRVQSTEAPR